MFEVSVDTRTKGRRLDGYTVRRIDGRRRPWRTASPVPSARSRIASRDYQSAPAMNPVVGVFDSTLRFWNRTCYGAQSD